MKLKTSIKMSDSNIEFWRKGSLNTTLKDKSKEFKLTPNDFQEYVVKFFKLKNDVYLDLIEFIIKMEKTKHGN